MQTILGKVYKPFWDLSTERNKRKKEKNYEGGLNPPTKNKTMPHCIFSAELTIIKTAEEHILFLVFNAPNYKEHRLVV